MLNNKVLKYNAIFFSIIGLLSLVFGLAGLGAVSIIFAAANMFMSLIYLITKEYQKLKTTLIIGGVLFLIGFGLCSSFRLFTN